MNSLARWKRWLTGTTRETASVRTNPSADHLLSSLLTMAWFVEARDPYTGGHLWRVSKLAYLLAQKAGRSRAECARISLGGFLHDLGKIGVPDAILRKPGRLSDEEMDAVRTHPDMGRRLLAGHPMAGLVQEAVYLHHERPDGLGYPQGLSGDTVPLMARIVGICDAFDAMTSHRPYRAGMPEAAALSILVSGRDTQFDATLVDHFHQLSQDGELSHIVGHSDDGIPLQTCPMCGPTLVVQRGQTAGQRIYCRACSGQFKLVHTDQGLRAEPTGQAGRAQDLLPSSDVDLIALTVKQAVQHLPLADWVAASNPTVG